MKNHSAEDIEAFTEEKIEEISNSSLKLVELCNVLRESIGVHPSQSNFRVAAIFIVSHQIKTGEDVTSRVSFVCGSNAEQGYIGGAICAERATLCRLRFYDQAKIMKVIVTTDSEHAIAPGGLCREFLMSAASPDTPVIAGNARSDRVVECRLEQLWPYPYLYRYCLRCNLLSYAEEFSWKVMNTVRRPPLSVGEESASVTSSNNEKFSEIDFTGEAHAPLARLVTAAKEVNQYDEFEQIHPLRLSGAVLFGDGYIETSWQWKALEYGCTLDPISQLLNPMRQYPMRQAQGLEGEDAIQKREVCSPRCIVMIDQFGVCHAPFAAARSLLFEHGFQQVQVLVHSQEGKLGICTVKDLFPTSEVFGANLSHNDFV